jgi:U3 small nucleolar RNA-associated protein 5
VASQESATSTNNASMKEARAPLSCFDPLQGQLYAEVSSDSRLRLWDAASGELRQQYAEVQHLSKHFTAIAWHRPGTASAGKKRSSAGSEKAPGLGLIALGTHEGTISVWDLQVSTSFAALPS